MYGSSRVGMGIHLSWDTSCGGHPGGPGRVGCRVYPAALPWALRIGVAWFVRCWRCRPCGAHWFTQPRHHPSPRQQRGACLGDVGPDRQAGQTNYEGLLVVHHDPISRSIESKVAPPETKTRKTRTWLGVGRGREVCRHLS